MSRSGVEFLKEAFPKLIEATGDPTAPIKLQEAHKWATAVGKMLGNVASQEEVGEIINKLEENVQEADTPEFLMVVASMFCTALEAYTIRVTKGGKNG